MEDMRKITAGYSGNRKRLMMMPDNPEILALHLPRVNFEIDTLTSRHQIQHFAIMKVMNS